MHAARTPAAYSSPDNLLRLGDAFQRGSTPSPAMTIMLDITPETAVRRKSVDRDRYERDLAMQTRVRESYRRLASEQNWLRLDGERTKDAIAADVFNGVDSRLPLP